MKNNLKATHAKTKVMIFSLAFILAIAFIFFALETSISNSKIQFTQKEISLVSFISELEILLDSNSNFTEELNSIKNEFINQNRNVHWLIDDFYNHKQIRFDSNSNNIKSILPTTVLSSKNATCLGAALWLHLASHGDLNLILLPDHIILQDHLGRFYEPNLSGFSYKQSEYAQKYSNKKWTGFEWKALETKQIKGILLFQLANGLAYAKNKKALEFYQEAQNYFPKFYPINENFQYWQKVML